jgi:ketosteroid isomerase-like protein
MIYRITRQQTFNQAGQLVKSYGVTVDFENGKIVQRVFYSESAMWSFLKGLGVVG